MCHFTDFHSLPFEFLIVLLCQFKKQGEAPRLFATIKYTDGGCGGGGVSRQFSGKKRY